MKRFSMLKLAGWSGLAAVLIFILLPGLAIDGSVAPGYRGMEDEYCLAGDGLRVTDDPASSWDPEICWAGDKYGVVWTDRRAGSIDIFFTLLSPTGEKLVEDLQLSTQPGNGFYSSITWDDWDQSFAVVYQSGDPAELFFVKVSQGGQILTGPRQLTHDSADSASPDIVALGGEYSLVWMNYRSSINFTVLRADGTPKFNPVIVTAGSDPRYPSSAWNADRQELGIAWNAAVGGTRNIFFALVDREGSVKKITQVTATPGDSEWASLVWTGTEYGLAWQDDRHGNLEIFFTRLNENGNLIDPTPLRVTDTTLRSNLACIAWNGSEYGITCHESVSDYVADIYFARVDASGNKIGLPIAITTEPGAEANASLAWNGSGYGIVWYDKRHGNPEIYFNALGSCIPPNSAPVVTVEGGGVYEINTVVTLDGYVYDMDGDLLDYTWWEGNQAIISGKIWTIAGGEQVKLPPLTTSTLPLGIHTLRLQVSDGIADPVNQEITVEIVDTIPPVLALTANKTILWPANHQMTDIVVNANVSDNSGLPVVLSAVITSNEPAAGPGDPTPDWTTPVIDQESGIITFQLRAERWGKGDGRIYTITITASDTSGNTSTETLEINVPHHKKKK